MNDEPRAATKELLGSYDAIETLKPGEPVFPVQGGDPFGPRTVMFWAGECRTAGLAAEDPKEAERLLRKASDAELVAWDMQAYQRGQKPAADGDRPAPAPAYTGWVDEADDDEVAARQRREGRIACAGRLHNAIAITNDVAETLARLRVCPEAEVLVREAFDKLREAARDIEPRRGSERS